MPISANDSLPNTPVHHKTDKDIDTMSLADWSKGRKVVLFALPGAFTPTCSVKHLPSFVEHADAIKAKGVDAIGCLSVNDAYVMDAWGKANDADGVVDMFADPLGQTAEALGIAVVKTPILGNTRAGRMALIAEDGVVTHMFMEEPGVYEVSSPEHILKHL